VFSLESCFAPHSPSLFYVSIACGLIVAGFSIASFWPSLSLSPSHQAQKRAPESRELLSALATDKNGYNGYWKIVQAQEILN
jgi:hypothetical protein